MGTFNEKPVEMSKSDWMERLQLLQVTRADMNRLIMNYLVTGKSPMTIFYLWNPDDGKLQLMCTGQAAFFIKYCDY